MFLTSSLDWFLGKQAGHMGPYQYASHKGLRDGKSTSGALLWKEAEAERCSSIGNMVNAETNLLHRIAKEIVNYVPAGSPIVELGPGTTVAFKNKTLPIAHSLKSRKCVLVDESFDFLNQISAMDDLDGSMEVTPVIDDFFDNRFSYLDGQALVCSFGSTISNIINPISPELPTDSLVKNISHLASAADKGWVLVGFDSDQNGDRIKNYFMQHALFQLNIFDRMAVEFDIKGDFAPKAFDYQPEWISSSCQLAHVAVVNRDMSFSLGNVQISLKKGQKLHIKNSYKFTQKYFAYVCGLAGIELIKTWEDNTSAKLCLLRIPRKRNHTFSSIPLKYMEAERVAA